MIRSAISALHDRWANLHLLVRLLALTCAIVGICLFSLKPAYGVFKQWRLERNLASAREAVEEERMDDARDLSLTVLRAGDPCIEAYRILEKSTASLRDLRHGDVARALISHPDGTDEDRLTGFKGIVMNVPLGLLGQAWVALPPECHLDCRFAQEFANRLIEERRFGEAASVLLVVPEEKRSGAVNRGLVRVLIGSGRGEGFDEAQRLIVSGMPADGPEISEWLDVLEMIPAVSLRAMLLEPLRRRLENSATDDPARTALILARMDYASYFPRRAEILAETIAKWKDRNPELLARFLNDLGLHQLLLDTFPTECVEKHATLFPEMLEAAERAEAWDRGLPLLDAHGRLLPRIEELAHRAVFANKTAAAGRRNEAWNAAMTDAEGASSNNAYLTLHRIARDARMPDEAEQALVAAIRTGRGPLPLYSDLKPLLQSLVEKERENVLLEICAIYLSFEPGNPVLLTQYAYLACLNHLAEPATILKALEPLAKAFPKELPIQCVLAMVYLCDDRPAKAAETLDGLKLDPAKLNPGYRATFLATQVLNCRMAGNDPQIEEFPWQALQASERRKFAELIKSADQKN